MASTRGERTRAAVVAAARTHFAVEGYEGATGARIAAEVGVSEPTIQHHFGSKAGLLAAVIRDYYDDLLHRMDDVLDQASDDPALRLRSFARWWLEHNAEHIDLLAVFGRHGRSADDSEVSSTFVESNRRVTRAFERLIADLKRAGLIADEAPTRILRDMFFGAAEHVMSRRALTGSPASLESAADDLVGILVNGSAPAVASGTVDGGVAAKLDEVLALLRPA